MLYNALAEVWSLVAIASNRHCLPKEKGAYLPIIISPLVCL